MQRVTITLDDELMSDLDRVIAERGYQNRSEAVRDLVRAGLGGIERADAADEPCMAALVYVYDHNARDLSRRLTNAYHDHHDISLANMHVHLNRDTCMEVSVLRGRVGDVRHFAEHVIAERSVRHGELVVIPNLPEGPGLPEDTDASGDGK